MSEKQPIEKQAVVPEANTYPKPDLKVIDGGQAQSKELNPVDINRQNDPVGELESEAVNEQNSEQSYGELDPAEINQQISDIENRGLNELKTRLQELEAKLETASEQDQESIKMTLDLLKKELARKEQILVDIDVSQQKVNDLKAQIENTESATERAELKQALLGFQDDLNKAKKAV